MRGIRFVAQSARFAGNVRVGLVTRDGECDRLPRLVGRARTLELLWTGDFVDAGEVLRLGIFSPVHPDDELLSAVCACAGRRADLPPVTIQLFKWAVRQKKRSHLRSALDLVSSPQAVVRSARDVREAYAAFGRG